MYFGGRAVNFIGQQQVGKDGAQHRTEFTGLLIENARAHQIGGQQIRGELNAVETAVQGFGQGVHCQGLGQSRHAFNEQVALCQQRNQHAF